ncbi:MAG: (Fe-S)-binding protein [Chloroflexota bacterium]
MDLRSGFTIPDPPSAAALGACVHCGLCLPHCPTFRELRVETASPRGRLHLIRAFGEGRLEPGERFERFMGECLDCRACEAACPSGVPFGALMEATRAELRARRAPRAVPRLWQWLLFRVLFFQPGLLEALGAVLRLYQRLGIQRLVRASGVLDAASTRLADAERMLPGLSSRFYRPRGEAVDYAPGHRRVGLFAGCVMRVAFADTHRSTAEVLRQNACAVVEPVGQGCCGALHVHAGDRDGGRELARRNIEAFEQAGVDLIVVNAAGCGAAMKEYGLLLADDARWAGRAERFSQRVRDFSELLPEVGWRPPTTGLRARVTYQDACHLSNAQGVRQQPRDLLRSIPGIELVEMPEADRCCGSAGVYNITQPALAERFGSMKASDVDGTSADLVVSANPGCLIQLRAHLAARQSHTRAVHIADLLAAAYRRASVR